MCLGLPALVLVGSLFCIALSRSVGTGRALAVDALSFAAVILLLGLVSFDAPGRDLVGVAFVLALAARALPGALLLLRTGGSAVLAFALVLTVYAGLALWTTAAVAPYGDQVHFLIAADALAHGRVEATVDARIFRDLIGVDPSPDDLATHVVLTPVGPRLVQGYLVPLALVPGWIAGGRLGATLVGALAGAWAAAQTFLLLRETVADVRARSWSWLAAAFLAPVVALAPTVYPNVLGAAALVTAYRWLFTAPVRRPLLAGALCGATLFITPRDGLVALVLLAFAWAAGRATFGRAAAAFAAVGVVACATNTLLYGVPVPYAGYLFGTAAAQTLTAEPSLTLRVWVGLPAILYDRTFGVAGSAPWLFIGALGAAAALRARRDLMPAAVAIAVSLLALSVYRYWEGGYAPPARYMVEVVPLAAPFVAYGLARRDLWSRAFAALALGLGALAALLIAALPARALNSAFEGKLQELYDAVLGLNPLGWLPSFQPVTPDWYVAAYLRLVPGLLLTAALAWWGWRRRLA